MTGCSTTTTGRHIDIRILGRGPTHVLFRRKTDGKRYDFPIEDLSAENRAFVIGLPVTLGALNAVELPMKKKPRYLATREKKLAALIEERGTIRRKMGGCAVTKIQERSLARDLRLLAPKIERLETQIAEYWRQNPPK